MECPLKSNGDLRIFVWYSHRNKGENTQEYLWDIHTKKSGTVPLRKRGKKPGQSTQNKGNVWNKRKQGGL